MVFTMHSHSGQFCPGHAKDQLEDILKHAISIGYTTIGFTEHMPRYEKRDLYPEELDDPKTTLTDLQSRHEAYLVEAQRLQRAYASQIHILIGFEAEFIRPSFAPLVRKLAENRIVDYFIGSVHHVHGIPIDYDRATYVRARDASGVGSEQAGTEERLCEDYYDLQFRMLQELKPRVVGHFDLIRLLSEDPESDVRPWKGVWERIMRNLKLVAEQGGWLECNSAALRKGLAEPYPGRLISEEWLKMDGRFTFSDDSHGISQVATNYASTVAYLESLGVKEVWTFKRKPHPDVNGNDIMAIEEVSVPLTAFREMR
ncbi:Polymerase/histidinol phosphatase-like protein [Dactylonectria macrodidyma]|uniref:Histidinol-phosphatase n=1 Tax=Dactylonectria macrodidyma TaxID=307937 RepID=A0A9P9ITX7_9HYPO|nr:Polymerase/histidinol phosphatase-like protein [Dactylonectria macrodidyma]